MDDTEAIILSPPLSKAVKGGCSRTRSAKHCSLCTLSRMSEPQFPTLQKAEGRRDDCGRKWKWKFQTFYLVGSEVSSQPVVCPCALCAVEWMIDQKLKKS